METFKSYLPSLIGFISALVIVLLVTFIRSYKRKKSLQTLAISKGLYFSPQGPEIYMLESTGISLFNKGSSKEASNLIKWNISGGIPAETFEYEYKMFSNKSRFYVTLTLINLPKPLPQFVLRPEYFSDKLAAIAGYDDIDINECPEFSKKYFLKGKNRDEVKAFFSPEIVMFFERHPGWFIEVSQGFLACWKGETGDPMIYSVNYQTFMEEVQEMVSVLLRK